MAGDGQIMPTNTRIGSGIRREVNHDRHTDTDKYPVRRGKSTSNPYTSITNTILNSNAGSSDIEDIFINSARDGAHDRLLNFLNRNGDALVSVNVKDKRTGNTGLIWSAKRGHVKIVQLLLKHGADITLRNYDGQSALEVASPVIKQAILNHVEQSASSSPQRLSQAAWIGNHEILRHILSSGRAVDIDCCNSEGFTPLLLCVRDIYMFEKLGTQLIKNYQPLSVVKQLVENGADMSAYDHEGKTALHYCVNSKSTLALNISAYLIQKSHTELRDKRNLTALHYACQAGNIDSVDLLIECGADVNCRGFAGTTPLHIAAINNQEQIARMLLESGADPLITDDSGQSPIDVSRLRKLKTLLKSWKNSCDRTVELAPVRGPRTPRGRQLSAGSSRGHSALSQMADQSDDLQRMLSFDGQIKSLQKYIDIIKYWEGTRLLGTPRVPTRSASREKLTPLSINRQPNQKHHSTKSNGANHHSGHKTSSADDRHRSHSTSDMETNSKRTRLDMPQAIVNSQRPEGVMSVEVLGLSSADRRRRKSGSEVFYHRTPTQHDFIICSHHVQIPTSPVPRLSSITPYHLPEIHSNSPLLSTIHEDGGTLPRSVMADNDNLRQTITSPDKLLHRHLPSPVYNDDNNSHTNSDHGEAKEGLYSLLKSEFVLEESRTEEYRSQKVIAESLQTEDHNTKTSDTINKPSQTRKVTITNKTTNRLQAVAKDNAAHSKKVSDPASHELPKTIVSTILVHATKDNTAVSNTPVNVSNTTANVSNTTANVSNTTANVSKGKIIVHDSHLLNDDTTTSVMDGVPKLQLASDTSKTTLVVPTGLSTRSTDMGEVQPQPCSQLMDGRVKETKHPSDTKKQVSLSSLAKSATIQQNLRNSTPKSPQASKVSTNLNKIKPSTLQSSNPAPVTSSKSNPRSAPVTSSKSNQIRVPRPAPSAAQAINKKSNITVLKSSAKDQTLPANTSDSNKLKSSQKSNQPITRKSNSRESVQSKIIKSTKNSGGPKLAAKSGGSNNTSVQAENTSTNVNKSTQKISDTDVKIEVEAHMSNNQTESKTNAEKISTPRPVISENSPERCLKNQVNNSVRTLVNDPVTNNSTADNSTPTSTQPTSSALYTENKDDIVTVDTVGDVTSAYTPPTSSTINTGITDNINNVNTLDNSVSAHTQPISSTLNTKSGASSENRIIHRMPTNEKWVPPSENLRNQFACKQSAPSARSYQPLHLLMNSAALHKSSQNSTEVKEQVNENKEKKDESELDTVVESANRLLSEHSIENDKAFSITFSEHKIVEHNGPVIQDIFENFPRPIYEFAQIVAKDMADKKAVNPKKKKKKIPVKSESRLNSAIKSKRTKGTQATPDENKKRLKSAKKKKGKAQMKSTATDAGNIDSKQTKTALISGVGWHIEADRCSDADYGVSDSDGGATTADEGDDQQKDKPSLRNLSFKDMSPRQKREQLRNLLLLMKNADVVRRHDGSTISLIPETIQAIHEFANAMSNERELNQLIGLESSLVLSQDRVVDHTSEVITYSKSDEEDSIPDISEIDLNNQLSEDEPAMILDLDNEQEQEEGTQPISDKGHDIKDNIDDQLKPQSKPNDRCVSTAMTDIIDEILNTHRTPTPDSVNVSPKHLPGNSSCKVSMSPRRLPDSLVKEIHEQWEKASQSVSNSNSLTTNSSSTKSAITDDKGTSDESDDDKNESSSLNTSSSDDEESDTHSTSESENESFRDPQEMNNNRPPLPYRPRANSASPLPKIHKIYKVKQSTTNPSSTDSTGNQKGNLSFSEVDSLPIVFPDGVFDEHKLTASLKSEIRSRPNSRTVVSQLGVRRSSIQDDSFDYMSHHSSENPQILRWKKGNILGKGAFGTVYCGLTSDGHLIAVKQIELNVHDWEKAEKEYESIQEEVNLLKTLKHINIVGFLGTSLEDHVVSIFMQFVPGGTIASVLSRFGALEERVFQKYTLQIVQGISYLHDNGVIHRDIKGANIMLMSNGVIKLIDFGCAKRLCLHLSVSQSQILKSMKGTPYWMAPEVIKETGHGFKSDIWSIGCTVFEMATTKPPWSEMQPMAAIFAIGSDKPVPDLPNTCSKKAQEFTRLCMHRDPNLRKSARDLLSTPFLASLQRS